MSELLHQEITEQVIGAAFEVYKKLGYGFLEKVYKNAMKAELALRQVSCELEAEIKVHFKGNLVGEFFADLFVTEKVIVELKTAKTYCAANEAQLLNELKATGIKVGLKDKVEFKRLVY
jgi:GxxExxY protein